MLVCRPLETPMTQEHLQGMSILGRREMRQVVYFMACGACGCIHRIEFDSIEDENAWFNLTVPDV